MPSVIPAGPSVPFEPKMAGGVANPNAGADPNAPDGSNVAWESAPATSHLWGWKYVDIRTSSFLRKFPGRLGAVSILTVRFRGKGGRGIAAEYQYGFADPDAGQAIVEALRASPHPHGQVLHPRVIKAGVPYTRT